MENEHWGKIKALWKTLELSDWFCDVKGAYWDEPHTVEQRVCIDVLLGIWW